MDVDRYVVLVRAIASGKWTHLHALMVEWKVPLTSFWCRRDGTPTFEGMCIMLTRYLMEYYVEVEPASEEAE